MPDCRLPLLPTSLLLVPLLTWITACSMEPVGPAETTPAAAKAGSYPTSFKRAQYLMGTIAEITAVAPDEALAQDALMGGFQEIRRLEQLLSTWIDTSEVSRVNRAAGRDAVPVSAETFEVLTRALEVAGHTGGGFDVTIGPAVRLWKVNEAHRLPSPMELAIAAQYVDYRRVRLMRVDSTYTVYLEKAGMELDVGGIGKGYAAEKAAAVMRGLGATGGMVAIAGDFRVFGSRADGSSWPIGIQHPRQSGALLATFDSSNEAISTSGDYERFFFKEGRRYHHILDPRTLMPAQLCQSVTIVAPEGATADAFATGVFVMGPVRGLALVERLGLGALIVDAGGRMVVSSGLLPRLRLNP
jgi:FAD:protein FMN transferase